MYEDTRKETIKQDMLHAKYTRHRASMVVLITGVATLCVTGTLFLLYLATHDETVKTVSRMANLAGCICCITALSFYASFRAKEWLLSKQLHRIYKNERRPEE